MAVDQSELGGVLAVGRSLMRDERRAKKPSGAQKNAQRLLTASMP